MKDYLIRDSYKFSLPDDKTLKDALTASMAEIKDHQGTPALEVVLDATHGGYINGNYTNYRKEGMQKAAATWFTPYPKPVLVEHDDSHAAIGRVVDAQYIDIPVDQQQMAAGGQKGRPTAKITLKAVITDMESIQKVLDGRFMTVSISARPKTAPTCSVCNQQVDGPFGCEDGHIRGKTYDGKLAHYIVDEMTYSEVSFVNKPADQSETHVAAVTSIKAVEAPMLSQAAKDAIEEALQSASKEKVGVADSQTPASALVPEPVAADAPAAAAVEEPCPECEDSFWSEAEKKEIAPLAAEYDTWLESAEAGDAVLTTAARKKLSASTFCGPDRSFPVPDCKHAANAKARLTQGVKAGRISSASASKISACINRKAKSMGCFKDSQVVAGQLESALEILGDVNKMITEEMTALIEQKKQAEAKLSEANGKIDKMLSDLQKAQDELKKLKEGVVATEAQHKTDLEQNKDLTLKLRDFLTKSVILSSIILRKDTMVNIFSGSKTEDRAQSYESKVAEFKGLSMEQLTIKENELFDELKKTTIISNIEALLGQGGDPELANKVKAHTDRKQMLKSWIRGE